MLRGKLNRLVRRTKGYYSKTDGMMTPVACVSVAEVGLDLAVLHVLRIPNVSRNCYNVSQWL